MVSMLSSRLRSLLGIMPMASGATVSSDVSMRAPVSGCGRAMKLVGQVRWGAASLVHRGDRIIVVNESGELVLACFTPEGYAELDRVQALVPTSRTRGGATGRWGDRSVAWAHPAFANRHVVMRNDQEVLRVSLAAADYD